MLCALRIQNFALIERLDLHVDPGFTVLTGETGAGKSILLGALQLALGGRADVQSLALDGEKCIVEADFILSPEPWRARLEAHDLDFAEVSTLRREISAAGKSRAFINDTPVRLESLKEISEQLIDIHSQRDNAFLSQPAFVAEFLDRLAGLEKEKTMYDSCLATWKSALSKIQQLDLQTGQGFDSDYSQFVVDEIRQAMLEPEEEDQWREELRTLSNMEAIQTLYAEARESLEGPMGAMEPLAILKTTTDRLMRLSEQFKESQALTSQLDQLAQEALRNLEQQADRLELDPERLLFVENRLAFIDQLQRKHRVSSIPQLLDFAKQLEAQLDLHTSSASIREAAEQSVLDSFSALQKAGESLHQARMKEIPSVLASLHQTLGEVNLSQAVMEIRPEALPQPGVYGAHRYDLFFSANPGAVVLPVHKVASGGERNRLMLALKALFVQGKGLQTLLLDEIDTGVSGGTAARVAELFKRMAEHVQLIAITHLPQVAGAGSHHWRVQKWAEAGQTYTGLQILQPAERIEEVARLLAGEEITETARAQARSLLST
ncbi:MAG: DNA repair protein RecN [Schleiferiaceae bacterium]|nr:DNA repair protein RecN [Schleiferiaceae bacterium]